MCLYLGNEKKYEAEIFYVEVTFDTGFDYGIEIGINCQNRSNLMT